MKKKVLPQTLEEFRIYFEANQEKIQSAHFDQVNREFVRLYEHCDALGQEIETHPYFMPRTVRGC